MLYAKIYEENACMATLDVSCTFILLYFLSVHTSRTLSLCASVTIRLNVA